MWLFNKVAQQYCGTAIQSSEINTENYYQKYRNIISFKNSKTN